MQPQLFFTNQKGLITLSTSADIVLLPCSIYLQSVPGILLEPAGSCDPHLGSCDQQPSDCWRIVATESLLAELMVGSLLPDVTLCLPTCSFFLPSPLPCNLPPLLSFLFFPSLPLSSSFCVSPLSFSSLLSFLPPSGLPSLWWQAGGEAAQSSLSPPRQHCGRH